MVGAGQGKLILLLDVAAAELAAAAAIVVAVAVDFTPVLRNHFLCFLLHFFFQSAVQNRGTYNTWALLLGGEMR